MTDQPYDHDQQYGTAAPQETAEPETSSTSSGQILNGDGSSDLIRVRFGDGDDATTKAGRLVVSDSGAVMFEEAKREGGENQ